MNLFIQKTLRKLKLDILGNRIASFVCRRRSLKYNIMSIDETIEYIVKNNCSVARFGDGELLISSYATSIGFQRNDETLKDRLVDVLENQHPNILICIIDKLNSPIGKRFNDLSDYWKKCIKQHYYAWTKHIYTDRIYGDANLSRISNISSQTEVVEYINNVKRIWKNKNVIMVEGEKTRFGVGNPLLDNTKSIKRILCPAKSAFDFYQDILKSVVELSEGVQDCIVLIALGPTATVLAYDLGVIGIQAIDIGHLDICYEKILTNNSGPIPGKYTNEAFGGDIVEDCSDELYLSSIVKKI